MARSRGTKGNQAELLFEKWLLLGGEWSAVHRAARPAFIQTVGGRGFMRSYDLFGCLDFLCVRRRCDRCHLLDSPDPACLDCGGRVTEPEVWATQVTSASSRSAQSDRRRKIERVSWPSEWLVSLVVHERTPDPANRRRSLDHWRVQSYVNGTWGEAQAIGFDRKAVEAVRVREARAES